MLYNQKEKVIFESFNTTHKSIETILEYFTDNITIEHIEQLTKEKANT